MPAIIVANPANQDNLSPQRLDILLDFNTERRYRLHSPPIYRRRRTKGNKTTNDAPWQQAVRQLIRDNKITRMSVEADAEGHQCSSLRTTNGPAAFMLTIILEPTSFNDEFINGLGIVRTNDSEEMTEQVLGARAASKPSTEQQKKDERIQTFVAGQTLKPSLYQVVFSHSL